ncbi:hypothetical protein LJB63_26415, partial [[Eubacterium] rectale]|nr:hypothetical protein [Agathobacter rectalis]
NMNTNANWVAFGAGNTLGGGTVFIDGKGFHFSAGATAAMAHVPEPERLPEKVYVAPEEPFCIAPWVAPISKLAAVAPAE